ncbi:unnamed protein product [Adineta steineri]|uniref:LRRCT domain-containing protein n=1 Tax=Adineta steineri TaxID=433720 RepID=A0A815Q8J5_9BILA|nr:unnamed protein product [Adineta steineri]
MPLRIFLIFFLTPVYAINLLDLCQSGIRDDGSNYVHCARKSLSEIPHFSSHRLFNLAFDELILSDNAITHIDANAFNGLRIKRLIMSGNRLKSIDKNAFRELENYLEQLTLEFDPTIVDTIPEAIQTNLANIRSLTLTGLNLRILPSNIFEQMKKLEILSLKSCNLQSIDYDAFHSIEKQLRYLYLDYNQLDNRISNILNRLITLETLSLSHNHINQYELKLINKNLRYLDLSYNGLGKLFLTNMKNLQILNVQNNLLTSEQIIGTIPNQLKELILDFNSIRMFNENFLLENNLLETLSLQSNDFLLNNSTTFQHLNKLKRLNLARNNIKIIPKGKHSLEDRQFFSGLFNFTGSLEHLNMDRNPLLPLSIDTFSGIESSLRNISCQSCSLTSDSLPAFSRLINLERFKLQSNLFTEIKPDTFFSSMPKLIAIDLQRNQLKQISSEFPITLRELELGNNYLTNLPFNNKTFQQISQLITLDLSSNPLQCDCHIKSLYHWLLTHFQTELVPYVQWICAQPKELSGKQLGSLLENQLLCEDIPTTTTITTTSIELTTEHQNLPSFNVWLKDSDIAILEWSYILSPLKLIVYENGYKLPILDLNSTDNYFLLEKLKSSTNYTLCLESNQQILCRNLLTPIKSQQKILSLSSSSKFIEKPSFINDIQYLITGIACGIIVVLVILLLVIVFLMKQREKFHHNSSKTIATDSYYQTTGSDTTQIGGSCSLDERSTQQSNISPMFYYCRSPPISNCCQEQQPYHFYHEIPFTTSSNHLNPPPPCLCRPPITI